MRILSLYNTRGMVGPLEALRNRHLEHCDLFVHCGNTMVDFNNKYIEGYVVIQGPDDFEQLFLRDYILNLDELNILIINNIDFRGKNGQKELSEFVNGLYDKIDVVFCATTVYPHSEMIDGILYVSPGDANDPLENTYSVLATEDEGIRVSFFDITSGELKKMDYYETAKEKR